MHWLHELDVGLLRFINQTLSNPFFDALMPFASGNRFFIPAVVIAGALLLWKGGRQGRLCALMLVLIVWPGDSLVCNSIKRAVARPRPYVTYPDLRQPASRNRFDMASVERSQNLEKNAPRPGRKPGYNSMPSSHSANWFAATMIFLVYFRRSWRLTLPLACLVSFSRLYNGVHYPSDVLAGMILGAGYAVAGMWAINALWQWAGRKWFPLWWEQQPTLLKAAGGRQKAEMGEPIGDSQLPIANSQSAQVAHPSAISNPPLIPNAPSATGCRLSAIDQHWLRLGYLLIAVVLIVKLTYLGSGLLELTGDEAYQWMWSKHPSLSYISKPPLIAYVQFVSTHLWGDTEFGVRFFSPVIGAILGFLLLRFFAREVNARAGFCLIVVVLATPLAALGSTLLTVDPLSVVFWTSAMLAGWRAIQPDGRTSSWLWAGLWMGFGVLSKYAEVLQWLCWAVFFVLWKPARVQLRRPGPYLALAINLLFFLPVVIWNFQHGWSGVSHLAYHNARLDTDWHFSPRYFYDFISAQAVLLNPVFFIALVWAAIAFWRRSRHDMRLVFLFSMGAPLFLSYLLYSFRGRVLPNWIAPSMLPLLCLMTIYWDARWQQGLRAVKRWFIAGTVFGLTGIIFFHEPDLVKVIVGRPLPPKPDPITRARAYGEAARIVNEERLRLQAEGTPTFIIGGHYQMASLFSFYVPEARTNVNRNQLVYCMSADIPENQYHYWPGYREARKGQNAIFVRELSLPPMVDGWFFRWLKGEMDLAESETLSQPAPRMLSREFESVKDLGQFNALYRGRVFHTFQLYECRNLR